MSRQGGDVVETTGHVIELVIPFGFPHFPPSCKPKSDIFHPDFDPAAICLGDFWNQESQLSDLIIHLGRMINGELYSRTNAFNEEACLWYQEHDNTFPLAELLWQKNEPTPEMSEGNGEGAIDTLEESDLSTSFDIHSLQEISEKEEPPSDPLPPPTEPVVDYDADLLHLLKKQGRFFTLHESFRGVDAANLPEEVRDLFQESAEKVKTVHDLHRKARKFEKAGDYLGAMNVLENIAESVTDFPGLEEHRARLAQSLSAWKTGDAGAEPAIPPSDSSADDKSVPVKAADAKRNKTQEAKRKAVTLQWKKRVGASLLGGITVSLLAGGGYYSLLAGEKMKTAEAAWSECSARFEKDLFEEAKRACEEAQAACNGVRFLFQDKVRQLRANTGQILQSEKMNHGLKGMVLVDGQYLSKKDAESVKALQQLRKEAEASYEQGDWQAAIERYAKMLSKATGASNLVSRDEVAELKSKHDLANFRLVHDAGMRALQDGQWREAVTELGKAEALLHLVPEADRPQYTDKLKGSLTKGNFEQSRTEGDLFFANSEWKKAIAAYETAVSTPGAEGFSSEALELIRQNMKRAELYDLIDQGIKAFGAGAWDKAIGDYRRAEDFLASQQVDLNMADAEKSIKKLSRIILQAMIVRDRQIAAAYLEKNELRTAQKIYRQLMSHIDHSPFSSDAEFLTARKDIAATVKDLDEKIFVTEKSGHLEAEYKPLFAAQYPTAVTGNLINPVISYSKDDGDKAIFKMQCTDTGGGRPLTLVMYYAFDRKSGQWAPYSEQQ